MDKLTIYEKYPDDLFDEHQHITEQDLIDYFEEEVTLEKVLDELYDRYGDDFGDGIAFRIYDKENELQIEVDCATYNEGDEDIEESLKTKTIKEINVIPDYYGEDSTIKKPVVEIYLK